MSSRRITPGAATDEGPTSTGGNSCPPRRPCSGGAQRPPLQLVPQHPVGLCEHRPALEGSDAVM